MPGPAESIEWAAKLLRLLSDSRRLDATDLAAALRVPNGTVHVLLHSLVANGLVREDPDTGKYQLGAVLLHLGAGYLRGDELRICAAKWAESLALETQHAARVGRLCGLEVLIVQHVPRPADNLQTSDLGALLPAHASALGKVLLAHGEDVSKQMLSEELCAYTEHTVTNHTRLARELVRVRRQGWALSSEEMTTGQAAIAAPILDAHADGVGAIEIVGSSHQLLAGVSPQAELLERVRAAAAAISREMGGTPW